MYRTLLALGIALGQSSTATPVQVPVGYTALVQLYIHGRTEDAVSSLARWKPADIAAAVKSASDLSGPDLITAAVLHTEVALAFAEARTFDAMAHTDAAIALLHAAARDAAARERVDRITRQWYYVAANLYVAARQGRQASWYVREGLRENPHDAWLYLARGTIAEMNSQAGLATDLRRDIRRHSDRELTRMSTALKSAVDDYQRALNVDPHLALAHLRIGWIRLFLRDRRARPELEAAAADARSDRIRYLARLFLGGLDELEERTADAAREYEAALQSGSRFQTPYLALSRAEEALGHGDRARELADTCAQLKKDAIDPWWDFAVSFDREGFAALQMEAGTR